LVITIVAGLCSTAWKNWRIFSSAIFRSVISKIAPSR